MRSRTEYPPFVMHQLEVVSEAIPGNSSGNHIYEEMKDEAQGETLFMSGFLTCVMTTVLPRSHRSNKYKLCQSFHAVRPTLIMIY